MQHVVQADQVPPDPLHEKDLSTHVRRLRAFLGQTNIDVARQRVADANADENIFRLLVLRQKLPWLEAFDELDRGTLRGARPLPAAYITETIWRAALAGHCLSRVLPTLPESLRQSMAARLLDLHGRVGPVLMEWEAARFYLRRGFALTWNEGPGYEFRCDGLGLAFEIECKQITRFSKEALQDRHAVALADAVVHALSERGFQGDVVVETQHRELPPRDTLHRAVAASLPAELHDMELTLTVPGVGTISGHIRPLPRGAEAQLMVRLTARLEAKPHDCRGYCATVPPGKQPLGGVVVWLRGPRFSPDEHLEHIQKTLLAAGSQLSGEVPGVVMVEVEDSRDGAVFQELTFFRELANNAFRAHPAMAAVVWRAEQQMKEEADGATLYTPHFTVRNENCRFGVANTIPTVD